MGSSAEEETERFEIASLTEINPLVLSSPVSLPPHHSNSLLSSRPQLSIM